jgi:hypothetical protein
MNRFASTIAVAVLLSCSPNYQSGSTKCSPTGTCPDGFVCGDASNPGAQSVCYEISQTTCQAAPGYYCPGSATCWAAHTACDTVVTCPDGTHRACGSEGYTPDCSSGSGICHPSGGTTGNGGNTGSGGSSGGAGAGGSGGGGTSVQTCPPPKAGGTCNVFPACGCPTGQTCSPNTQATGLKCFPSGSLGEGADCTNGICASGLGCFGGLCSRYCQSDSDCPAVDTARACVQTHWSAGVDILGVLVCARVCDPVSPHNPRSPLLACPVGFGCSSWGMSFPGASDCEPQSGGGVSGSTCSTDSDCTPGYYCSNAGNCMKYCYTVADCPTGKLCTYSSSTPNYAGTTQVGYCN